MRRAQPLLGTIVDIAVMDAEPDAEAAIDMAFGAVADIHRLMSFHDPASDVSRVNRDAARQPVVVDERTHCVLQFALDLHERSEFVFDIAIGRSLQAMNLLPSDEVEPTTTPRRPTARLIELLPDRRVLLRDPGIRIDLGGIAKGYAVDCAVAVLRACGMRGGFVNAGGDCAAFGPVPQYARIRDSRAPGRALCEVALLNDALASSAGHFDPFVSTSVGTSTIIDPRTREASARLSGASVRAPACMMADALTKIVMLTGKRAGPLLATYGAQALFVSAEGEINTTSNWQIVGHAA